MDDGLRELVDANIHDVSKLLALAGTIEVGFSQLANAAETLAPFAEEIVEFARERLETDENQAPFTPG